MKTRQFLFTLIITVLFLCYCVAPAQACTPAAPTTWFNEIIKASTQNPPPGISFYQSDWDTGPYSTLWINNDSEKTIQIISKDGKVIQETTDKQIVFLSDSPNYNDKVLIFESRNIQSDNRPENVKIPDEQSFEIPIKVDQNYYKILITVTYTLNENYRSTSVYDFENGCRLWYVQTQISSFLQILPYIILIPLVCVIALVALYRHRKKKNFE